MVSLDIEGVPKVSVLALVGVQVEFPGHRHLGAFREILPAEVGGLPPCVDAEEVTLFFAVLILAASRHANGEGAYRHAVGRCSDSRVCGEVSDQENSVSHLIVSSLSHVFLSCAYSCVLFCPSTSGFRACYHHEHDLCDEPLHSRLSNAQVLFQR